MMLFNHIKRKEQIDSEKLLCIAVDIANFNISRQLNVIIKKYNRKSHVP